MDDYPIQGKLRIRAEQYDRDRAFIEPRVGKLSAGQLKGMPGFEFLKSWYVDFAATPEQWAELQPELDRRNILVTLYEAPVFYTDAFAEDEEKSEAPTPADRVTRLSTIAAALIAAAGLALVVYARLDIGACVALGVVALMVAVGGRIFAAVRTRRRIPSSSASDTH